MDMQQTDPLPAVHIGRSRRPDAPRLLARLAKGEA